MRATGRNCDQITNKLTLKNNPLPYFRHKAGVYLARLRVVNQTGDAVWHREGLQCRTR